jgi:NhaA family Na+:H+ antiporter
MGSGIHATVAGVLLAMAIPVRTRIDERAFLAAAGDTLNLFSAAALETEADSQTSVLSNPRHHEALERMESLCEQAQPPLIRLEHALHPWVALGIMPLFALANAGISLAPEDMASGFGDPVWLAVAVGLLIGKPVGIVVSSWMAVRLGWAVLPRGVTWRMIAGVGALGGIGFTMALFVGELAFGIGPLLDSTKLGIVAGSVISGLMGWLLLRKAASPGELRA